MKHQSANTVEISRIDLKYEEYRLQDKSRERILLSSILERGFLEPLQGVFQEEDRFLLLDGFKRYRCARRLAIKTVPCISLGEDVAIGILQLLRRSNEQSLHLMEQARLVTDLQKNFHMSAVQIAAQLERSPAWVVMRIGLLKEMSPVIKKEIFSGRFPTRSFMYTLRQFTRVKKVPQKDVDEFVESVSGKNLSGRSVDSLARAFFQGGENFREQIRKGNFGWTLEQLNKMEQAKASDGSSELNEAERTFLRDLEIAQKYESRVIRRSMEDKIVNNAFFAEAELLTGGIKRQLETYGDAIGRIHDRCREAKRNLDLIQAGKTQKGDCAAP